MTVRVVLALALASVLAFPSLRSWERRADEAALAGIAGSIAGREVEIDCPGTFEDLTAVSPHDGTVEFGPGRRPADRAELSGGTCDHLRRLRRGEIDLGCLAAGASCPRDVERAAVAVNVLAHESFHLAGEREEWLAQCHALQANSDVALRLGASPEEARGVAEFVLEHVQPALPADYQSPSCHDGGPLDLHPERLDWP
ncbi:MAG: hypothetical protein ACRDON_04165 [Gaiellaceae bacterium]